MKNLYVDKKLSPALYKTMRQEEHILVQGMYKIKELIEKTENNGLNKKLV